MFKTEKSQDKTKMLPDHSVTKQAFMPTFLQAIFRVTGTVNLIYCKNNSYASEIDSFESSVESARKESIEEDDAFVGNPLEVDLKGDETLEISGNAKDSNCWLKEESTYFPLEYKTAQELLNEPCKSSMLRMCICNGKDPRKTLSIGLEKSSFGRYLVRYCGKRQLADAEVSFSNMLKKHIRNCGTEKNVDVSVHKLFGIIGHHKRLARDVQNTDNVSNSAFIECTGKANSFALSNEGKARLYLQVNAQSPESSFHSLWRDLCKLEELMDALRDNDTFDQVQVGPDVWQYYQVVEVIQDALDMYATRHIQKPVPINWQQLDLNAMRPKEFLEILWGALTHLGSIEQIRQCFHSLFQEFASESSEYKVPQTNHTLIGHIIKGLIDGTTAVPTLTLEQTLKYFLELGLNKIHNDYMHLIKEMDDKLVGYFEAQWSTIVNDVATTQISKKGGSRKSRLTIVHGRENYAGLLQQLNYIAHLHLIVEFMNLVRSFKVDNKSMIYDGIAKSKTVKTYTFKTLKLAPVVDFECAWNSSDIGIVQNANEVAINVQMHSALPDNAVTTIFHFSQGPIYPDTIFNNYGDYIRAQESMVYYVYEGLIIQG